MSPRIAGITRIKKIREDTRDTPETKTPRRFYLTTNEHEYTLIRPRITRIQKIRVDTRDTLETKTLQRFYLTTNEHEYTLIGLNTGNFHL